MDISSGSEWDYPSIDEQAVHELYDKFPNIFHDSYSIQRAYMRDAASFAWFPADSLSSPGLTTSAGVEYHVSHPSHNTPPAPSNGPSPGFLLQSLGPEPSWPASGNLPQLVNLSGSGPGPVSFIPPSATSSGPAPRDGNKSFGSPWCGQAYTTDSDPAFGLHPVHPMTRAESPVLVPDLIPEASVHNQTSTALPSNNGPPPQAPTFSFTSDLHVDLVSTFAPEFQNSQADNNDDDTNNVQPASINKTVAETTTNTATKRQTFVCSYSPCDSEPFRNASDLRKHVERKHTRPYICCVCERNFGSKGDLDRHMNSLCPEAVPPGSLKRFMCHDAQCVGREFSRSDNFQEHMKTKHGEQKFNKKKMKKKKKKIEKKEKKTIHE